MTHYFSEDPGGPSGGGRVSVDLAGRSWSN